MVVVTPGSVRPASPMPVFQITEHAAVVLFGCALHITRGEVLTSSTGQGTFRREP